MEDRGGVPPQHVLQLNPTYSWSCLHTAGWRLRLVEKMKYSHLELPRRKHQAQPKPSPRSRWGGGMHMCDPVQEV